MTQFSDETKKKIAELCKKHRVRELSLFGSRVRDDYRVDSDFDFLVEFVPETIVTFMTLGAVQSALEEIVGLHVDLVPKEGLKPVIKQYVLAEAKVVYAI